MYLPMRPLYSLDYWGGCMDTAAHPNLTAMRVHLSMGTHTYMAVKLELAAVFLKPLHPNSQERDCRRADARNTCVSQAGKDGPSQRVYAHRCACTNRSFRCNVCISLLTILCTPTSLTLFP